MLLIFILAVLVAGCSSSGPASAGKEKDVMGVWISNNSISRYTAINTPSGNEYHEGVGHEVLYFYEDGQMKGKVGNYVYFGDWTSIGNQEYEIKQNMTDNLPTGMKVPQDMKVIVELNSTDREKSRLYMDSKNANYYRKVTEDIAIQDGGALPNNKYYSNSTVLSNSDYLSIELLSDNNFDFMILDSKGYDDFGKAMKDGGSWKTYYTVKGVKVVKYVFQAPANDRYYVVVDNSDSIKDGAYAGHDIYFAIEVTRLY